MQSTLHSRESANHSYAVAKMREYITYVYIVDSKYLVILSETKRSEV